MSSEGVNNSRRRFLLATTSVVGAVGAGFAAVPFIKSWQPSAKAQAVGAPVTVNVSALETGQMMRVTWRGKAIGILRRTPAMLERLPQIESELRDPASDNPEQQPAYAKNEYRSIKPEIAVLNINCTHLGCIPVFESQPGTVDADWPGGFFCPCHKSKFDLAGRVFKGVPAPTNLLVPPYHFADNDTIVVGIDPEGAA